MFTLFNFAVLCVSACIFLAAYIYFAYSMLSRGFLGTGRGAIARLIVILLLIIVVILVVILMLMSPASLLLKISLALLLAALLAFVITAVTPFH